MSLYLTMQDVTKLLQSNMCKYVIFIVCHATYLNYLVLYVSVTFKPLKVLLVTNTPGRYRKGLFLNLKAIS
jgi:hypothetical protein